MMPGVDGPTDDLLLQLMDTCGTDPQTPVIAVGRGGSTLAMIGDHSPLGWCWCQPPMRPHGDHAHPWHREAMA